MNDEIRMTKDEGITKKEACESHESAQRIPANEIIRVNSRHSRADLFSRSYLRPRG
jgi:hypothetical protein